jgi:hypothetical protein
MFEATAAKRKKLARMQCVRHVELQQDTISQRQGGERFVMGDRVLFDAPRCVALKESLFCHMAHRRGQSTVYLRFNGAIVPGIYGPSADEH